MSKAIVDPSELRRFAQTLKRFNSDIQERTTVLAGQLDQLSSSWRDQENKKFTEEFQQHMRVISRFLEMNELHIPYLLRKAEAIDEYLRQR